MVWNVWIKRRVLLPSLLVCAGRSSKMDSNDQHPSTLEDPAEDSANEDEEDDARDDDPDDEVRPDNWENMTPLERLQWIIGNA